MAALLLALGLAATAATAPALAADCDTSWAAPTDGDWNVEANWDNGLPGVNGPNVCIDEAGTYTVHVGASEADSSNATATAPHLILGGDSGEQTLELEGMTFYEPGDDQFRSVSARLSLDSGTIGPNGRLVLDDNNFAPAAGAEPPGVTVEAPGGLDNEGVITSDPGIGGERRIAGSLRNCGVVALPNRYTMADGAFSGTLAVSGDYAQSPAATLEVETGGETEKYSSHWSHLAVDGAARLDGGLGIREYYAVPEQSFRVLTAAGGLSGEFASLTMEGESSPQMEAVYGDGTVDLLIPPDDSTPADPDLPAAAKWRSCARAQARVRHLRHRLARVRRAGHRRVAGNVRDRIERAERRAAKAC